MDRVKELIEKGKTIQEILSLPEEYRQKVLAELREQDPVLAIEVEEEIKKRKEKEELIKKAKQAGLANIGGFSIERFIEEEFDIEALKKYLDDFFQFQKAIVIITIVGMIVFFGGIIAFVILELPVIIVIPIVFILLAYLFLRSLKLQFNFLKIKKAKLSK